MVITDVDAAEASSVATMVAHQSLSFFSSSAVVETVQHSLVQDVAVAVTTTVTVRDIMVADAIVAANYIFTPYINRRAGISCPAGKFNSNLNTYFQQCAHRLKQTKL